MHYQQCCAKCSMSDVYLCQMALLPHILTVSHRSATLGEGHSFTVSPRVGRQCYTLFSLAVGSPVSDKKGTCWIVTRHQAVSDGDVNMHIAIATHLKGYCHMAYSVSGSLALTVSFHVMTLLYPRFV